MNRCGTITAPAVLVAVLLVAAACGGEGGGSASRVPSGQAEIPTEPTEQVTPPEPPDSTARADPTDPTEDSEPTGESTGSTEALTESTEPGEGTEPAEPTESGEGTEPPGPAEELGAPAELSGESTGQAEPAEESQPSEEEVGESEPSGETEPAQEAEPSEQPAIPEVPQTPEPPENPEPPDPPEPPEAPESPEVSGSAAPTPGMLDFFDCGRVYRCATLAVPIDHDDPDAGTIDLAVGMLPAGDPSRRIGYLLVNPGGPGAGMDGFLDSGAGLSRHLLERFDLVGWDPRGVGAGVPVNCRAETNHLYLLDPIPDSPDEQSALDEAARAVAEACAAGLGDVVGHIGTIHTARDIDLIRQALGADEISYFGFSYGTLLGALYADMFGEHLRAAVLDGAVDPSLAHLELFVGQVVGFDRTIRDMFDSCRNDPRCPILGDPREAYENLRERVESDPLTGAGGEVVVGPAEASLAVRMASYLSEFWPYFFDALAQAVDGNGGMLQRWALAFLEIDLGAFVSIGCADSGRMSPEQLDQLTAAIVEVAGGMGASSATSARPCVYWPVSSGTLSGEPVAAPNAPPIVVLGNRGDNATPYEWAVSLAAQLESGVLVSYDGAGHLSYGKSACVDGLADSYLIDLAVPADGLECAAGT